MTRYNGDGTLATDLDEVVRRIRAIMSPDPTDGGVTAAAIEAEVEKGTLTVGQFLDDRRELRAMAKLWKEAAREHIGRSDTYKEWMHGSQDALQIEQDRAEKAEKERDMMRDGWNTTSNELAELRATLTPDAITDEMVKRAQVAWLEKATSEGMPSPALVRIMFAAALTEPQRPEGAEKIEELLRAIERAADMPMVADYLARNGVRVTTEEER